MLVVAIRILTVTTTIIIIIIIMVIIKTMVSKETIKTIIMEKIKMDGEDNIELNSFTSIFSIFQVIY